MKLTEQLPKFIPQGNRFEPFYYEKSNVNFFKNLYMTIENYIV